jgi:hypothetical protein
MYKAIAQALAKNAVEYETINQNISLDSVYGINLNRKAKEYGIKRLTKESDSSLRNRIKIEIYNRGINKPAIVDRLLNLNTNVNIADNYQTILSTEDNNNSLYTNNWGEGYLQGGSNYNSNITTFNFNEPVEEDVYNEVYKLKPAGTKIQIRENLTFFIQNNSTGIKVSEVSVVLDDCGINTENNLALITEDNTSICP